MANVEPSGAEDALDQEEEQDAQPGARRQGNDPGHEDSTDDPQVEGGDAPGQPNAENGPHQGVGGGNGQPRGRGQHDRAGGAQLGGKAPGGGQLGDLLADGGNDLVAIGGQADNDADGAQQQHPAGQVGLGSKVAPGLDHAHHRRQWANGIGGIVGAVGKGHRTGGEDHHDGKDPLDAGIAGRMIPALVIADPGQQ